MGTSANTRKRKLAGDPPTGASTAAAGSGSRSDGYESSTPPKRIRAELPASKTKEPRAQKSDAAAEKRVRRFRAAPPKNFDDVYGRAISQRFYVLDRTRSGTDGSPEELVELAGSTGNVYHVRIAKQPTCDCPHAQKGHQCKHWLYVMSRVLRAKFEHVYQLALLDTELREIFANAPPPPDGAAADCSKHRKAVEGDCPICFDEMDANAEAVVWCKAACGQNIHKECFETWAATKRRANVGAAAAVTCPYCRSVWKGDEDSLKNIKKTGNTNFEGYVNVASQLGIDTVRDTSTYHSSWRYWANRRGRPS